MDFNMGIRMPTNTVEHLDHQFITLNRLLTEGMDFMEVNKFIIVIVATHYSSDILGFGGGIYGYEYGAGPFGIPRG